MSTHRYDHPNALVRREVNIGVISAGTAGADVAHFFPFQKGVLKGVHAKIIVAGTATNTYAVKVGSTTVGNLVISTSTAGVEVSATGIDNEAMASFDLITMDGATTDATGTHAVVYEWEVQHDAVLSD